MRCGIVCAALLLAITLRAQPSADFDTEQSDTHPLAPGVAAESWQLPPGFHCTVFAAEPDVRQPIAMVTDPRGRLWVAENYTYSERLTGFHPNMRDRIVVFEDADNDGHFDRRTVFWEGPGVLTSIEIGLGGIWALVAPQLLFIPDRNGDDVPDGKPVVVLDGFDIERARHNVANGLRWGPDGWLYGRQGIQGISLLGPPGTPDTERVRMNAGIWRYHPTRRVFEVVAAGTTNPWGMDWNEVGEPFFINTVIGHLWHVIPGAYYRRMSGADPNPRVYEVIDQHADHVHWATGEAWTDVRRGVSGTTSDAGGGHAHSGLLIYQGGQWPANWHGKLLMINFHGRRLNVDRLERSGGGYVGRHEPDAFFSADPWFRGIDLLAAPDGGVFVSDWSDTGECHDNTGVHRSSGRIFKLIHGHGHAPAPDLTRLTGRELARLQTSPNDWLARSSRRVLADRVAEGRDQPDAIAELRALVRNSAATVPRLRALWALHVMQASEVSLLESLVSQKDEYVRAWALRLLADHAGADFARLARDGLPAMVAAEPSALVRLTLASLLQRLPPRERIPLAASLLERAGDATDHNLPLMLWYGIEPIAAESAGEFARLTSRTRIPLLQRFGFRRLAENFDQSPQSLDAALLTLPRHDSQEIVLMALDGIADGLSGRRNVPPPESWSKVRSVLAQRPGNAAVRERLDDLAALFGDGRALATLRAIALDPARGIVQRRGALKTLVDLRADGLRELCEAVIHDPELFATAAAGLALFDDPAIAGRLLEQWPRLFSADRRTLIDILVSRPAWAAPLLEAVADGRIERQRLVASHLRQLRGYRLPALDRQLAAAMRDPETTQSVPAVADVQFWRDRLGPETLARASRDNGRAVYQMLCAACHRLTGEGGTLGPDLTGAGRDNLDYLLENILTPNAQVADDYRLTTLTLRDGRTLAGFVRGRSGQAIRLQTMTSEENVAVTDIAKEERQAISLMPEGLLAGLKEEQVRDLFAYLMAK